MSPDPDDDLGAPIEAIERLRVPASPTFLRKVRGRIARRSLGIQLLDMTWSAPAQVLLEFLNLIFGALGGGDEDRGGGKPWNKKDSERT